MGIIGILIIGCIVSGIIGMILGSTVNKTGEGLLWGCLLGPIGWLIILLLPRHSEPDTHSSDVQSPSSRSITAPIISDKPLRDLSSDAYKIWLGKTYDIKKNLLFEKYELNERLFETLDEAIYHADSVEQEREADIEKEKKEAEREALERKSAAQRSEVDIEKSKAQDLTYDMLFLIGVGVVIVLICIKLDVW